MNKPISIGILAILFFAFILPLQLHHHEVQAHPCKDYTIFEFCHIFLNQIFKVHGHSSQNPLISKCMQKEMMDLGTVLKGRENPEGMISGLMEKLAEMVYRQTVAGKV
jgi:hypothetical protein